MSFGIVVSAIFSMYYFNLFTKEILLTGMITSPIYILASYIGSRFYNLSGNQYFRNASLIVLIIIGITTLLSAFFNN
jgi:putative Mn2+ efflux pump MntP